VAGAPQDKSIDRRTERRTKVSQTADERKTAGKGPRWQITAGQCKKEGGRRRKHDNRERESQDRSAQIALEQRSYEKANRRDSDADSEVPSALMPLVRMTTDQDHTDDAAPFGIAAKIPMRNRSLTPQLWIKVGVQN